MFFSSKNKSVNTTPLPAPSIETYDNIYSDTYSSVLPDAPPNVSSDALSNLSSDASSNVSSDGSSDISSNASSNNSANSQPITNIQMFIPPVPVPVPAPVRAPVPVSVPILAPVPVPVLSNTVKETAQSPANTVTIKVNPTVSNGMGGNIEASKVIKPFNESKIIAPDGTISDTSIDVNKNFTDVPEFTKVSPSGKPLKWYEYSFDPRSYSGAEGLKKIAIGGGKTRDDLLVKEAVYEDFNRLPPSFVKNDYEPGYSFMPPKDWYPLPPYPPVCVSSCKADPKPYYMDTLTMDLKEWQENPRIMPPDAINTDQIIKLNST